MRFTDSYIACKILWYLLIDISHVNFNFEKLSGYSKREVEGKKSSIEFLHPDEQERMKKYHYLRRHSWAMRE